MRRVSPGREERKESWSLPWEASRQSAARSNPVRGDAAPMVAG